MRFCMRLYRWRGIYYVEINGKRRSLRTRNAEEARRLFNQIKRQWLAGKLHNLTGKCKVTLGKYRDEFVKWSEEVQPTNTFKANRLALNKLIHYAGETITLDRVSKRHLDQMAADCKARNLSVATINNYIRHARASLNKAVEWGHLTSNPLAGAKEIPTDRRPPGYLDQAGAVHFLKSIKDVAIRRFAAALIATGRRRSELFNLMWEELDLKHNRYFVRNSKDHLSRWYPMNSMFRTVLESIGVGKGRVFATWRHPDTLTKLIKQALIDAGYPHLRLHDLRHTFASLKAMEGLSLKEIGELLGHSEMKTTQIYAHLTDDHLADIAEIKLGPIDLG